MPDSWVWFDVTHPSYWHFANTDMARFGSCIHLARRKACWWMDQLCLHFSCWVDTSCRGLVHWGNYLTISLLFASTKIHFVFSLRYLCLGWALASDLIKWLKCIQSLANVGLQIFPEEGVSSANRNDGWRVPILLPSSVSFLGGFLSSGCCSGVCVFLTVSHSVSPSLYVLCSVVFRMDCLHLLLLPGVWVLWLSQFSNRANW